MRVREESLFYAFRYALGKGNFAPLIVMKDILDNLYAFDEKIIKLMIKEIEEAPCLGMDFQKVEWLRFKEKLESTIK